MTKRRVFRFDMPFSVTMAEIKEYGHVEENGKTYRAIDKSVKKFAYLCVNGDHDQSFIVSFVVSELNRQSLILLNEKGKNLLSI